MKFKNLISIFYLLAGLMMIFYVSKGFLNDIDEIKNSLASVSIISIILAIILYVLSHLFRVLRLTVLSSDSSISIKDLTNEQFKANGVNLIIPFRLGESYRILVFKKFFGSYFRSFNILLCERMLDITLISVILIIATYFSDVQFDFIRNIIYISISVMIFLLLVYFVLDEFLLIIHQIFLGKDVNKTNITIVKITSALLNVIKETKNIFKSKLASCMAISLIIWTLEILVFYVLFINLNLSKFVMIFLATSVALSSLLPNGPIGYGGVQLAFFLIGIAIGYENMIIHSYSYNFFIFGSGLFIASVLFLISSVKSFRGTK
tara:strand:+ start:568 stop:1527 length:960 start_codon:yes stop_codon:yes gene_type:complete